MGGLGLKGNLLKICSNGAYFYEKIKPSYKLNKYVNVVNYFWMNSQKFYFLETRKFSYLRLSRGANFSSFKITKLHTFCYMKFHALRCIMTNVCSLSLSPRVVMKSIPKSGCVLLVQGWQLRSHFIPAHQMKRYKKTGLRVKGYSRDIRFY